MKVSHRLVVIIIALSLALLELALLWYPAQIGASLLLLAAIPGIALTEAMWPAADESGPSLETRLLIGIAASYGLTITLLLLLAFVGILLNQFSVVGGLAGLTLIFTVIVWRRPPSQPYVPTPYSPIPKPSLSWLIVILLLAGFFRLVNVGYSDYQGDEADILSRAVMLIHGEVDALLTHSKGPGEILLLDAVGTMTDRFDEQTARLPFSLAGVASVGLIFLLGHGLFNRTVGLLAGMLAAIDGVFVSYARTAQYQSVVLLLTVAAIVCFYHFQQSRGASRRWHFLGTFLISASFLVHFETMLLLPLVVYFTLSPYFGTESTQFPSPQPSPCGRGGETSPPLGGNEGGIKVLNSALRSLWPSLILFLTLLAIFYVPFLLHPKVGATGTYLENRIGGGEWPPFNNLGHFFYFEALKYNSAYYVVVFNFLLLLAFALTLVVEQRGRSSDPPFFGGVLRGGDLPLKLLCLGCLTLGLMLSLVGFQKLSALCLALGLAVFFLWSVFAPGLPQALRILWLWVGPPFWSYVFLVNRPGKHHYIFLAALTMLASWVAVQGWQWVSRRLRPLRRPSGRWLALGLGGVLLLIFAAHTVMVLLRSDLEYMLTYPEHKSSFYPTDLSYPYGTRIGFGYPFRLGWQTVSWLKRTGQLGGTWAGNDEGNAPNWYMLNTPQTPCYPDYVLRGEITYKDDDDFDVPFTPEDFGYVPRYRIWGNEHLRMTILAFDPLSQTEPIDLIETTDFTPPVTAADFVAAVASPSPDVPPEIVLEPPLVLGEGSELKNNAPPEYVARAQTLSGRVALIGYDLDQAYARPGSVLPLTLHWRVQSLLSLRYKVFVHLIDEAGQLRSQVDDFPQCGTFHANAWGEDSTVRDRYLLKLPADLPPGVYKLMVGMYEPDLNLRLNYFDIASNEQGNSLLIGTVTIGK